MLVEILSSLVALFVAIVFHEYAHGWVAYKLGDPTAKDAGRLSLNPIKHIDPIGTIFLPGILLILRFMGLNSFMFGWAKPVPVNFGRLRRPKQDMILVAMAGPAINIALALVFSVLAKIPFLSVLHHFLGVCVFINIVLAVFNMIPVPPLDGSRLVFGLLPDRLAVPYARLEPFGILIVVLLINTEAVQVAILSVVYLIANLLGVSL
ncbi:MAG: site-2 protease family protein [Candidatus Omnitrophica bacterium]|nr:site-2 protease family protein [Candidatus Omnitrophota bacterium]